MITVVDYGLGNLNSLTNMFEFIGVDVKVSSNQAEIAAAERLVLPGVGAFDKAMRALHDSAMIPSLERAVFNRSVPILGVCLGMQVLGHGSAEGRLPGLGWIKASVEQIVVPADSMLKVPNNGWHRVVPNKKSMLFPEKTEAYRYYFNHSYHMVCDQSVMVTSTISYGQEITSSLEQGNIMGVQFHPEKSHRFGMDLLARFAKSDANQAVLG